MSDEVSTGIPEGRVGRYVLEDLVAESPTGSRFWRASDPALHRPVGARLVPIDDHRVGRLREAARNAAKVHDRPIVQVLDVVETPQHLAVITEWVTGRPWNEVLRDTEDPHEAVVVAYMVARALQTAHASGVAHGRIRPSSVIISDTNEVRLRGLQVDAALYGVAPGEDPLAADLHGVGALLFAGLTGRWPDPAPAGPAIDGLPVAGPVRGRLPLASELVSGVPPELSRLAAACLLQPGPPRREPRIPDMDHAVAALGRAVEIGHARGAGKERAGHASAASTDRMIYRIAAVVVVAIVAAGAWLAYSSLAGPASDGVADGGAQTPAPPTSSGPPSPSVAQALPLSDVRDFDPQGTDGQENPGLVGAAVDGDPATAWTTVAYKSSGMDPKDGTGLLVDLGLTRPVREIALDLLGIGTDFEIRIGTALGESAEDFELLAGAVAAGSEITIRTPIPVETRYVLVWLTNLPYRAGTYQGGISELEIRG